MKPVAYPNLLLLLAFLPLAQVGAAQFGKQGRHSLSFGGRIGHPLGGFSAVWGGRMAGYGGQLIMPMRVLPLGFGVQYDRSSLGAFRTDVPIDVPYLDATEGRLVVRSSNHGFHAVTRFDPLRGRFVPYADLLAGWRSFSLRSKLTVDGVDGPLEREVLQRGSAFSWGWAAGLMVRLKGPLYGEIRVERSYSGESQWTDPGSIELDQDGLLNYEERSSSADALFIQAGISLRF